MENITATVKFPLSNDDWKNLCAIHVLSGGTPPSFFGNILPPAKKQGEAIAQIHLNKDERKKLIQMQSDAIANDSAPLLDFADEKHKNCAPKTRGAKKNPYSVRGLTESYLASCGGSAKIADVKAFLREQRKEISASSINKMLYSNKNSYTKVDDTLVSKT